MSKAVPGAPYTVVSGDTLTEIAKQAYGDGTRWREVWKANQTVLKSGDPNVIYPGEVLQIPGNPIKNELPVDNSDTKLSGKDPDDCTLIIEGAEILIQSARILRTMDTASDGWTAVSTWDPDDKKLYDAFRPYAYKQASIYLGGHLMVEGILYVVSPLLSPGSQRIELEGASYTADIVDSTLKPPYEQSKVTLEDRAKEVIPSNIKVLFDADGAEEPFDRVTSKPEDTIFDHLASLANQRSVLISSTRKGEVLFWRANQDKPVGTITENFPPYTELKASFDGRKRFNVYKAIAQSPKKNKITAVSKDDIVPKSRFKTFNAPDATGGNIQSIADWKRSKQVAEALTIPFPVSGWYAPNGKLWEENTLVTIVSPSIFVPDGFDFLIRSVEYSFGPDGTMAILNLIPPQVYSGAILDEPWAI
jgi:prophage tail gpP-like protein